MENKPKSPFRPLWISIFTTIVVFFFSLYILDPLLTYMLGYSSVEGSYHSFTHALILSLILVVMLSTLMILEEMKK